MSMNELAYSYLFKDTGLDDGSLTQKSYFLVSALSKTTKRPLKSMLGQRTISTFYVESFLTLFT